MIFFGATQHVCPVFKPNLYLRYDVSRSRQWSFLVFTVSQPKVVQGGRYAQDDQKHVSIGGRLIGGLIMGKGTGRAV